MRTLFFLSVLRIDEKKKICALSPEMQAKEHCGVPSVTESDGGHSIVFKG